MSEIREVVATVSAEFERIHHRSFLEDPACNPNLVVEVVGAAMVGEVPTLVLITPRTLMGVFFQPEGKTISELLVGKRRFPVSEGTLDSIERYASVNLVPDVRAFADREAAQHAAAALTEPFRDAVARAVQEQSVANPTRRDLFRKLAGTDSPAP